MSALAVRNPDAGDCSARAPLSGWRYRSSPFRDIDIDLAPDFRLESGERLDDPGFRMRLHGRADAPLIVAAGGISAGRKVADAGHDSGWWREIVGAGGPVDLDRWQVLGFDFLPGAETGVKTLTPADQARALAAALDAAGLRSALRFVGASYGGLVGLAFASLYPERTEKLAVISASARPDPMATALRGVQRRIIAFALECGRPDDGVALARELAMTTYRTAEEFRERFQSAPNGARAGDNYDICDYLTARGRSYARSMSPQRYISLSDSIDRASVDPSSIAADCLFVASSTDRLVPAESMRAMSAAVAGRATYHCIESLVGHDAFLCETDKFAAELKTFLEE